MIGELKTENHRAHEGIKETIKESAKGINQRITDFDKSQNERFNDLKGSLNQRITDFDKAHNLRIDDLRKTGINGMPENSSMPRQDSNSTGNGRADPDSDRLGPRPARSPGPAAALPGRRETGAKVGRLSRGFGRLSRGCRVRPAGPDS